MKTASEDKNLGIVVHESLTSSCQCAEAVKYANKTLGTFLYKDKVTMLL